MIVLYVLFALSVFCPLYTYVLYPIVLKIIRGKQYKSDNITPTVTVIVVGDNAEEKVGNIKQSIYPSLEVVSGNYSDAKKAKGDIIVFTDSITELDLIAIQNIVKPFFDERVGAVVGQQTNLEGNSTFWKYENLVKRLESRIGCVSGANESLFAVRKSDMPEVPGRILNKPFYIATKITESGKAVVFRDDAKAFEGKTEGANCQKHIEDAKGYWQALKLFPRMLIGRHGSFVYFSHRVMKWFVWLNMLTVLTISAILSIFSIVFFVIFICQVIGYLIIVLSRGKIGFGVVRKLFGVCYYFLMLNCSYFVGLFWRTHAKQIRED